MVVAATPESATNAAVSVAARERAMPVNVVDDAELSTFIFPAIIDRSPLVVAVSSAGQAPVLARQVREQIEALLPARLGALARFMGARAAPCSARWAPLARRAFWERIVSGPVAREVLRGDEGAAERALAREVCAPRSSPPRRWLRQRAGRGVPDRRGPRGSDLLTLRALQLLQQADVVLYDRLVGPQVLERARRDAERIFVGKEPGEQRPAGAHPRAVGAACPQGQARGAPEGRRPVRLRSRWRGNRSARRARHPLTVVPGITAALGAAACAAMPLTHRRLAQSVTFVTGHVGDDDPLDWRFFADPRHTVVFYMGVAQLAGIVARLRAAGAAAAHPAAVIERATLPQQRIVRGTLADIAALAAEQHIEPPALLIVGEVAAFAAAAALAGLSAPHSPSARSL